MDRNWYVRFVFMMSLLAVSWLALWPSLDAWLPAPPGVKRLFPSRISPGLDIRGGLRLSYEVEVDEAVRDRRDLRADQLQRELGQRFGLIKEGEIPSREQLQKTSERVKVATEGERRL